MKKLYAVVARRHEAGRARRRTAAREEDASSRSPAGSEGAEGLRLDKVESFAIDAAGDAYIVTDNDGVDDSSGETQFLKLGKL